MSKSHITKTKKRIACRLPIVGEVVERLYNPDSRDLYGLSLPNTALALAAIGEEKILLREKNLIICSNKYFTRYLVPAQEEWREIGQQVSQFHGDQNFSIGFLVIKLNFQNKHIVDQIFIDKAYRRQGIASWLIERALVDFPDLCLDGRFTSLGIIFFGAKHRKK